MRSSSRHHSALRGATLAALTIVGLLAASTVALAQAVVVVEVRTPGGQPADGVVTLTRRGSGEQSSYQCETEGGSCEIANVPGGQYVTTFAPQSGDPPDPRTVMIPPAGSVTLRVSTR